MVLRIMNNSWHRDVHEERMQLQRNRSDVIVWVSSKHRCRFIDFYQSLQVIRKSG